MRAGVVDEQGGVIDSACVATPGAEDALEDAITTVVDELRRRHTVEAVGLAVAGFVRPDRRSVLFAPHLPWRAAPVADRMSARLGVPVTLEHDANAAAVGEHRFGAARGANVALLLALGTGIGAGLLLGGEVFRGAHGVAPELGHIRVVPNGRPCPCGRHGCWERYCSGTALAATAIELLARWPARPSTLRQEVADPAAMTGLRVARAAREGDAVAREALADLARWLGEGLALIADVYDPEIVVLAGGVAESSPLFADEAREHYARVVTGAGHRPLARIRTSQLSDATAIVGAATLAVERMARQA